MSTLKLAELILDFTVKTITGFESALYKTMCELVRTNQVKQIELKFCVRYFNLAYKSLITNEDPYFVSKFEEMHNELAHSYICLLNIIFTFTLSLIDLIDRTKLDDSTYSNYMSSIETQIKQFEIFTPEHLEKFLSHRCDGIDIKTCNPNEPMFYIKEIPN